jgi:hypothetical protein
MQKSAKIGYLVGTALSIVVAIIISLPGEKTLLAKGAMNTGHEALNCYSCHLVAPGTTRQQLQAKVKYLIGVRKENVNFGYLPVSNEACLDCHARPNDRHPVSRFLEPRFAKAREAIKPHECISCHAEHNHKRVTSSATYCVECHQNLKVKTETITPTHEQLVAEKNWSSCLMCHDFHGNHVREVPKDLNKGINLEKIAQYFDGAPSPYSDKKQYKAKKEK